jgi:hypothetical protein
LLLAAHAGGGQPHFWAALTLSREIGLYHGLVLAFAACGDVRPMSVTLGLALECGADLRGDFRVTLLAEVSRALLCPRLLTLLVSL